MNLFQWTVVASALWSVVSQAAFANQAESASLSGDAVISTGNRARSSRENRESLKVTALWQPFGFGPIPEATTGYALGYFLSPNSVLQLEYGHTNGNPFSNRTTGVGADGYGSSTSSTAWQTDMSGYSVGLHLKQFLGNSFYVKGGVDYKNISRANTYSHALSPDDGNSVAFTGTSVAAGLAVGNQWQFSIFTVGVEWLGFSTPFASTVTSESSTGPVRDAGYSLRSDGEKRYLMMTSLEFLRFNLGASF